MRIDPIQIEQSGPGIDLSNLPEGLSVKMSDPVKDFKYARNAVTLTYDLSAHVNVRLSFAAMEFGDEPHAPPPNPFGDDADFDGVAVSADGVAWYEVQDLRHLRSGRFTDYDIDLDAAIAALGLSYGSEFRIRFCQYDNNPAPMDGIFLHGIELTADLRAPVFLAQPVGAPHFQFARLLIQQPDRTGLDADDLHRRLSQLIQHLLERELPGDQRPQLINLLVAFYLSFAFSRHLSLAIKKPDYTPISTLCETQTTYTTGG